MSSNEFLQALRYYPKSSSEYNAARQLWHCIHRASHNPMLNNLLRFGHQCVQMLADNLSGDPSTPSWRGCGYKYLSFQGFDADGLTIINYGNKEYHALLQSMALAKPTIHHALNRLRTRWPTLMDLWAPHKSDQHVERLADVVEIMMGAARGEPWFQHLWSLGRYRNCLPPLFLLLTTLCKIIQSLTAWIFKAQARSCP